MTRMIKTTDIRTLMKEGKQLQVLHYMSKNGMTLIVDKLNPKHVYGRVSRCVLQNFDTEIDTCPMQLYNINPTAGLKTSSTKT
jgi:hypothetical protein